MRVIPKSAFGYVVTVVDLDAGEKRVVSSNENGFTSSGNYFFTKGEIKVHVEETGEVLQNRSAGWLNTEHTDAGAKTAGSFEFESIEDAQWLCIPLHLNDNKLPNLSSLVLTAQETATLDNGTNLYLVRGSLAVNGKTFVGPTQIRIRSGTSTVTGLDDTNYSLKFL
jgi:hypothetical protein